MKGGSIKRAIIVLFASLTLASAPTWAFSDGSGWAAVTYLIKLVEQSLRHYQQLQMMIQYSKDAQAYAREINSGLDASIRLMESLPIKDEKILGQLRTFQRSLQEIEKIYGAIPKSPDEPFQQVNDMAVAESLKMVNSVVLPEHRGRGLYSRLLDIAMKELVPKGFQRIWSRHNQTNNAVIVPKLRRGFLIPGTELSDIFGSLVNLTFFTNKLRRKVMDFRSGDLRPDDELKKAFRL
ncbi:MAG: GNAT family N-acetyltransferase [Bdellovibrionaceae bacterium]|nr:GNAT family N-acetyltransferase [Pseudobdellovibrionaceae bacterium]